jgi:ATP/maltotriose-dependent transcriptional regulator MalT
LLLVLDDYHVIAAGPVHASLGFLLEHRPPGLHLVLASRNRIGRICAEYLRFAETFGCDST